MSAFGCKADMTLRGCPLFRSLLGAKRTCLVALHMSTSDPKRTWWGPSWCRFEPSLGKGNAAARVHLNSRWVSSHPSLMGVLPKRFDQSLQPTNQVTSFPQISAMLASTTRPIRTLRRVKPLSRCAMAEPPIRLDDFHGDPHFVPCDLEQARPNDER
jgi:hypothetical protein